MSDLSPQDYQLPVAHLQLSVRAHNGLAKMGCRTIAHGLVELETGRLNPETLGKKSYEDVISAVHLLREHTSAEGLVDWILYVRKRPPSSHWLAFTADELQRLDDSGREKCLGTLHLDKACGKLNRAGIGNIGALVDAARAGIGKLRGFGKSAHAEVIDALVSLADSIGIDGTVSWEKYAQVRGFPLLPKRELNVVSGELLVRSLPKVCQSIIPEQFTDREWNIFERRFLRPSAQQETLQALGDVYGITRERIRQLEAACIKAIQRPVLEDDYRGLRFRLRPEIGLVFCEAKEHFEELGLPAWNESAWFAELSNLWRVPLSDLRRYDRLLAEILGYEKAGFDDQRLESLIVAEETTKTEVGRLLRLVAAIFDLLQEHNAGLDGFQIAKGLGAGLMKQTSLEELPALIELCSAAESYADVYRVRFVDLRRRAEQVVRLLTDKGEPMHHRDLVREINTKLSSRKRLRNAENLVQQMTKDERLSPIGKSGQWALAEWSLEVRPLPELIKDILAGAGEGMHRDEIAQEVFEARPASAASIPMILDLHPDLFRKVGPKVYALTAWGDRPGGEGWWSEDEVARFVEDFFTKAGNNWVEFSQLREAFQQKAGLSSRTAQGVLAHHPAVEVERPDHRRRIARLRLDWQTYRKAKTKRRTRPLQRDTIVDEVKQKLSASLTGELPLKSIVFELGSQMGIPRPNLYAAISQSEELETLQVEGRAFKICRLRGRTTAVFPEIEKLRRVDWQTECKRAVSKLTLEDVDIGLFLFGRLFDKAMEELLVCARDYGEMVVSEGHLRKLANRIDWAVKVNVLTDKPLLSLLRNERNDRGHEPPSEAERKIMLNAAPFLAGLYVRYLVLIEERIGQFKCKKVEPAIAGR